MKTRPDVNKLAKEVYESNKAKEFHDKEYSNEHCFTLAIGELSEAIEADRKGKRSDINRFLVLLDKREIKFDSESFIQEFEKWIKDTLEDELADTVIRLFDLAGLRGYNIDLMKYSDVIIDYALDEPKTFPELIWDMIESLVQNRIRVDRAIKYCIEQIEYLCHTLEIDLWLHVELKLKYNQTRPPKHGKGY